MVAVLDLIRHTGELATEIKCTWRRAAEHQGRLVTVVPLVLSSVETGDACWLDPAGGFGARLGHDGNPEVIDLEETETCSVIGWKGNCGIDGAAQL